MERTHSNTSAPIEPDFVETVLLLNNRRVWDKFWGRDGNQAGVFRRRQYINLYSAMLSLGWTASKEQVCEWMVKVALRHGIPDHPIYEEVWAVAEETEHARQGS